MFIRSRLAAAFIALLFIIQPIHAQETPMKAEVALFLTIKTQPGKREELLALWDKHLKTRAVENDAQVRYVIARDAADADTVRIAEVYSTQAAFEANSQAPWFGEYMAEAGPLLAGQPEFNMGTPHWVK